MKKILFAFSIFLSFVVQTNVFANASNIQTAKNLNGDVVAVWHTFDGTDFNLASSTLPNGGTWSSSVSIGDPSHTEMNPVVAINNLGHIVIVWSAIDLGINVLYMIEYNGVTWSSITQVSASDETILPNNYSIKFDDTDWLVITWSSYSLTLFDNIVRSSFGTFGSPLSGPTTLG
ncbi:MAG: hypothetical protein Q8K60_09725 [Parachlamydiaceae bacterium]|nr:hypothetical protein [Parachlamydiaceae bacterium]